MSDKVCPLLTAAQGVIAAVAGLDNNTLEHISLGDYTDYGRCLREKCALWRTVSNLGSEGYGRCSLGGDAS